MLNEEFNRLERFVSSGERSLEAAAAKYRERLAVEAAQASSSRTSMEDTVLAALKSLGADRGEAKELCNRAWAQNGPFNDATEWIKAACKLKTA